MDINDLKYINDRFGHDYGDVYIRNACKAICKIYEHSPVFRVGGDEFVVILEGEDYDRRDELIDKVKVLSNENVKTEEGVVIACGMGVYGSGDTFHDVFHKADQGMYDHKKSLKQLRPSHNLR